MLYSKPKLIHNCQVPIVLKSFALITNTQTWYKSLQNNFRKMNKTGPQEVHLEEKFSPQEFKADSKKINQRRQEFLSTLRYRNPTFLVKKWYRRNRKLLFHPENGRTRKLNGPLITGHTSYFKKKRKQHLNETPRLRFQNFS